MSNEFKNAIRNIVLGLLLFSVYPIFWMGLLLLEVNNSSGYLVLWNAFCVFWYVTHPIVSYLIDWVNKEWPKKNR